MEENILNNENKEYSFEHRTRVPYIEKNLGDGFIKEKKFDEALKSFSKAIMSIKILTDEKALNEEELAKYVREIGVPSNLNLSYIYISLRDWKSAISNLNRVIDFDRKHAKALYRRCICYLNLGELEKADEDLTSLEDLIGGSKELEELETLFVDKKKKVKIEENKIYKKMLNNYIQSKDEKEEKELSERVKNIYVKSQSALSIMFSNAIRMISKPLIFSWNTWKHYFINKPLEICRRIKIRKTE